MEVLSKAVLVIVLLWHIVSGFQIVASILLLSKSTSSTTSASTLHSNQFCKRIVSSLFGAFVLLSRIALNFIDSRLIVFEESCFLEQAQIDCHKQSGVTNRNLPQIPLTGISEFAAIQQDV